MKTNLLPLMLFFVLATLGYAASADDVFIGTLSKEKGRLILTRCDFVQDRYVLKDKKGDKRRPVSAHLAAFNGSAGIAYAEVFGSYDEIKGENYLLVESIDNVHPGKSCHLVDPRPQ